MPQAVQANSILPSRKSRNSGEWLSRHFLRRPAKASAKAGGSAPPPRSAPGRAPSRRRRPARSSWRRPSSSFRKSRTSRTVLGESVLKNVELVVTRKPWALASRMAATTSSNTPSRSTAASWRSPRPSTWTTQEKYRDGVEAVEPAPQQHGVGAQVDVDLAPDQLAPRCGRCRGAAAARRRRSTPSASRSPRPPPRCRRRDSRLRRMSVGCWILPQPGHERLQANSGSISTRNG